MSYIPKKPLRIGDYAEPKTAGVAFWHLLRAPVMREANAAQVLEWLGLSAYVPLRVKTRKIRKAKFGIALRHVPASQAAFEGYVFAGFRRTPDWPTLEKTGAIRSVVTISSAQGPTPYRIASREVLRIHDRQRAGWPTDGRPKRAPAQLDPGDSFRVVDDESLFWGRQYRAEAVREAHVCALQEWLGNVQLIEFPLDAVCKAA